MNEHFQSLAGSALPTCSLVGLFGKSPCYSEWMYAFCWRAGLPCSTVGIACAACKILLCAEACLLHALVRMNMLARVGVA